MYQGDEEGGYQESDIQKAIHDRLGDYLRRGEVNDRKERPAPAAPLINNNLGPVRDAGSQSGTGNSNS